MRLPLRFLTLVVALLALGDEAQAACGNGAQARREAEQAARAAARQKLGGVAAMYGALYSNVSYDLKVSRTSVNGNSALVYGELVLRGTEVRTGRPVRGTFPGTVSLKRDLGCVWQVTGYQRG